MFKGELQINCECAVNVCDPSRTVCKNNTQSRNLIAFVDKNKAVNGLFRAANRNKRSCLSALSRL